MRIRDVGKVLIMVTVAVLFSLNVWAGAAKPPEGTLTLTDPYMGPESPTTDNLSKVDYFDYNMGEKKLFKHVIEDIDSTVNSYLKVDSFALSSIVTHYGGDVQNGMITINTTGYDYIALYYGDGKNDVGGGNKTYHSGTWIYACPDGGGSFNFDSHALSHFTLFKSEGGQVPLPPAAWLLGTGLAGLVGVRRKMKK